MEICGLTGSEDAAVAVTAGASYLGVVLAGGPRVVDRAGVRPSVAAAAERPVLAAEERRYWPKGRVRTV